MANYEHFAEDFITNLEGDLTIEQMRIVLSKLQIYSSNFDIEYFYSRYLVW